MATARAPYGRLPRESGPIPTYYGRPALKPATWGWLIATYFFVGGIGGGSSIVAAVADLLGGARGRPIARVGRYVALSAALISPVLLILDLGRKDRWYNMLRIYRSTSPMSIGSWTLSAFGMFAGLAAIGQVAEDLGLARPARAFARLAGLPAAAAGVMMAIYTGALLSATSNPLWLVPYRWLPAVFGSSAMATGTAAVTLGVAALGAPSALEPLERIGFAASAAELALTAVIDRRWGEAGVKAPVEQGVIGAAYKVGVLGVAIALPLALHGFQIATGRRSRSLAIAAAVATLAGGYAQRAVLVFGGRASAKRPEDYFTIAQPGDAHRWAPA